MTSLGNITRAGYKNIDTGRIPDGWKIVKLADICEVKGGKRLPKGFTLIKTMTSHPYIRVADMENGSVSLKNIHYVPDDIWPVIKNYTISSNDLYISVAGSLGLVGRIPVQLENANLTENADKLTNIQANIDFLFHILSSSIVQKHIDGVRTTSAQPKLALERIRKFKIPYPPIGEQQRIAQILSTWDRAIDRVQRLIDVKQRQKKGLMQGLLTGRLRFPEFGEPINITDSIPTNWETKKLKQVFSQIDRPLGNRIPESILSISAKVGFVDQKTKFGKVVAGKSLEKYILLQRGEFAYNRGNSNSYPQGCIYMLTKYNEGAIPNVYYAFRIKSGNIFPEFYQYYFESGLLNPQLKMFISSSARGDGLFNISLKDFFGIKIVVPPFEEQKKIAGVLGGMDAQIDLLKKYLVKIKEQKKGLMQKLLTGEIRVKVD